MSERVEVEIELGVLFATLHASAVETREGEVVVGAHVDLDGNVLGDTGLRHLRHQTHHGQAVALRAVMEQAWRNASSEIGLEPDLAKIKRSVAKAVSLTAALERDLEEMAAEEAA